MSSHAQQSEAPKLAVDAREAARMLSISPRHLGALVAAGDVPSLKLGRRRLFRVADLDRWLAQRSGTDA